MAETAYLTLEDGASFRGEALGAAILGHGEVVFNTSMTGYQEVLTDPSYAGQIVVLTYPLAGNYGINPDDFESRQIQVAGLVVREHCDYPSHGLSNMSLHSFLESQNIPAIQGVDTRAITRRLRTRGVMMGIIQPDNGDASRVGNEASAFIQEIAPEGALARIRDLPRYDDQDFVSRVSTLEPYSWNHNPDATAGNERRIVVTDMGLKYNILRLLNRRGCQVVAVPGSSTAEEIMALNPSGVLFSPGPGDPALLDGLVGTAQSLIGKVPLMGICLGHQVIARAFGADTFKLKFGHRGANHPVKDLVTGRVHITAQNHGYAVDPRSLPSGLQVTQVNLHDGTVEGMRHVDLPVLTIQYHSEASPGPRDNEEVFDRFLDMVPGK